MGEVSALLGAFVNDRRVNATALRRTKRSPLLPPERGRAGHGLSWPGSYEAFAHIWTGAMLGAWWFDGQAKYLWAVGLLTALEIVMYLVQVRG